MMQAESVEKTFESCESVIVWGKPFNSIEYVQVSLINGKRAEPVALKELLTVLDKKPEQLESIFSYDQKRFPAENYEDLGCLPLSYREGFEGLAKLLNKRIEVWTENSQGVRECRFTVSS